MRRLWILVAIGLAGAMAAASWGGGAEGAREAQDFPNDPSIWDADAVPGELIVKFARTVSGADERREVVADAGAVLERDLLLDDYSLVRVAAGSEREAAAHLVDQVGVDLVEPNLIRRALFEPSDEFYELQWHFSQIGLPTAWDVTMGAGVTVAVLDSGVAFENCSAAVCGTDYYRAPDFGSTEFVAPWDAVNGDVHPNDEDGHGTHVASTIAEASNNGTGGAGIAPDAAVMPVQVLGTEGGTVADEIDGIAWSADHGADVINMSLGGTGALQSERAAINDALATGVVVVAAAGNGGDDGIGDPLLSCPACYPGVIAVGATGMNQLSPLYSNYGVGIDGHTLDLVAPGGDTSLDLNDDGYVDGVLQQTFSHACPPQGPVDYADFTYCFYQGTSMASPHVAGVAALVLSVNPALSPSEVGDILRSTATDLGLPGYSLLFGYGEVNAAAAVAAAQETLPTDTPTPTVLSPPTATHTPDDAPTPTPHIPPTNTPPPPTPTRTATPVRAGTPGDANCNGTVNPIDAALILQENAGLLASIPCAGNADVNHDSRVDPLDAALILQYDAGLLGALPAGRSLSLASLW